MGGDTEFTLTDDMVGLYLDNATVVLLPTRVDEPQYMCRTECIKTFHKPVVSDWSYNMCSVMINRRSAPEVQLVSVSEPVGAALSAR